MFPEGLKTTLHLYCTDPYDHSRVAQESYSYNILEREAEMQEYQRHLDKLKKTGEYGYYYIYVCDPHKRTMDLVMSVENPLKQRMEINLKAKASNKPKRKSITGDFWTPTNGVVGGFSTAVFDDQFMANTATTGGGGLTAAALQNTVAALQASTQAQLAMQQAELQLQTTTGTAEF